jgi:SAM-dependent methyltransferase
VSIATGQHAGTIQGDLWSARALDWANYQEVQLHEVYTAVLAAVPKVAGQRILDVGCGSGAFLRRAAKHGAVVTGLDAAPGLVAIARRRIVDAAIDVGAMERLPYDDATFDVVTGINAFPSAAEPVEALREARRTLRRGGRVVVVTWGPAERSDASAHIAAVRPLLPPTPPATPDDFALAAPGALSELVEEAGFTEPREHEVTSTWEYDDETTLLRGLLSAGPMVRAVAYSGSYAVTSAVLRAAEPFRTAGGGYRLRNVFRYVVARG